MQISGDYLYVTAHSHGIRVFSLQDPSSPQRVGSLEEGFVDAFAIDVAGDVAYVADGGGGLKILDVSDPTHPVLIGGETLETAVGTSEDIRVGDDRVFVAAGGAGVAVYDRGDLSSRQMLQVGGAAEGLAWAGDFLVVNTLSGFHILDVSGAGLPEIVAGEVSARRDPGAVLRICSGVGATPDGRILSGNWNYMDVYRLVAASAGTQPGITPSAQRIRFRPEGGSSTVTIRNDGVVALHITEVESTNPTFAADFTGGTLLPGERVSFDVTHDPTSSENNQGVILFRSNDPDEDPLPIQVFGRTAHHDPGEPATDFTLPIVTRDRATGDFLEDTFRLSDHHEKVIWFAVYASW